MFYFSCNEKKCLGVIEVLQKDVLPWEWRVWRVVLAGHFLLFPEPQYVSLEN